MPASLGWFDHTLFLILAVLFPVRAGLFSFRRLRRAAAEELPRVKLSVYRHALVLQWLLVAVVAVLWLESRRSWAALGLVPRLTGGLAGVLAGLVIVAAVMLRQGQVRPADDEAFDRLRARTRHLERMLPVTVPERSWFFGLAVTAGICEEILYRGYMIWYLSAWVFVLPALIPLRELFVQHPFLVAAAGSSLIFGVGHAYQGPRGVLLTAAVGGFLAAVYWLTRSLFAGMLVHMLMDLHAGYITHLAYSRARERAAAGAVAERVGEEAPLQESGPALDS
jgi:membrane protease YdiL (CAAX protease family)